MTQYRTNKAGSAIITIVVILSITLLIATSIQRITHYARLSAIEREQYVFLAYLTDGLLQYGMTMLQEQKSVIDSLIDSSTHSSAYELFAGTWPDGAAQAVAMRSYKGIVTVSYRVATQEYILTAQLYDHNTLLISQAHAVERF